MKYSKRIISLFFALILLAGMLTAHAAAPAAQRVMLSWAGDPTTTMTITWVAQSEDATVRYSTDRTLTDAVEIAAIPAPNESAIDDDGVRVTATLTDLAPATTYWYTVGFGDDWTAATAFRTAERDADAFSFLYFGDIQVKSDAAAEFAAFGKLASDALTRNPTAAFALQGGDIVESGIRTEQWAMFLNAATDAFSRVPFMPTNGNHESNFPSGKPELYLDTFTLPRNGPEGFAEEFYSFDYGDVHVLVLNDWVFSGEQRLTDAQQARLDAWVAADLVRSAATWKIVLTHVPIYAVHSDRTSTKAREHWLPLFEKYGVSLMLVGHQHVYSRLRPLTGGVTDYDDGIVQIMGNAGQKHYSSADETLAERTIYNVPTYQVLSVDGDSLTVQTFNGDGTELDYTTLTPRGVTVTRAEFVSALYRAAGSPSVTSANPFSDVPSDSEYAAALAWAAGNGIVNGVGGGRFEPNSVIRAEHVKLILERFGGNM